MARPRGVTEMNDTLERQLRRGHPDVDGYVPPSFARVRARATEEGETRSRWIWAPRLAGVAAVLVVAVAAVAIGTSRVQIADQGVAGSDRQAIAALAGVEPAAVWPTEDGAVTSRWRDGKVQLILATKRGSGWVLTTLKSVDAPQPKGASSGTMESVRCAGADLARPTFVFGQLTQPGVTSLAIHGVKATGGFSDDRTFVFAIAGNANVGTAFWIDSPGLLGVAPDPWPVVPGLGSLRHPNATFEGMLPQPTICGS